MKYQIIAIGIVMACILMMQVGCYYDKESELYPTDNTNCDTTAVSYAADIQPVLDANCYNCHGAGSPSAGVNVETFSGLQTAINNQDLFCAISHGSGCSAMPQGGSKLPDCTINKFKAWIDAGAPNN
ncbi:MAG: hypothetical protein SFW35_10255 [Chitinophagales bacterium]|nr:hypothetical protein [Chitinophagales bacterium]